MSGRTNRGDRRLGAFESGTGRCALEAGGEWGVGRGVSEDGVLFGVVGAEVWGGDGEEVEWVFEGGGV